MRKVVLSAALVCAVIVFAQTRSAPAFTPTVAAPELHLTADNLTGIKTQLYNYQQSGQYDREIAQVVKPAHDWLESRTASAAPAEKLAAIFDIDETALSNLPYMMDCGFCSAGAQAKLYPSDRDPALPPVRELFEFAKSKGITVFFVTGRSEASRDLTVRTLRTAGYSGWEDLLMRLNGNTDPARIMKAGIRQGVERKGFKIILNIGDQLSDLIGGFAERTYKLPDPFYFTE